MAATTALDFAGEAFERFFAQEYGRTVSIAFRITRDAAEAEDVAQEVFARCARSKRIGSRGWVYAAAVHAALNAVRTRRRRTLRELRGHRLEKTLHDDAQYGADPQRIVEQREQGAAVRAALARIDPREAAILALRYSGLSYREIAEALTIDAAQIGTRLARAERTLKKEIERETLG